jgi:hypothetical protein
MRVRRPETAIWQRPGRWQVGDQGKLLNFINYNILNIPNNNYESTE